MCVRVREAHIKQSTIDFNLEEPHYIPMTPKRREYLRRCSHAKPQLSTTASLRATAMIAVMVLAGCSANSGERLADKSVPGWPAETYFETEKDVIRPAESFGWRIDTDAGPETDIWISTTTLDAQKKKQLHPGAQEIARVPGIFLRLRDNGTAIQPATACIAIQHGVQCKSADSSKVVVSQLDEQHASGALFSNSADSKIRYAAAFDASVSNESKEPFPATIWSEDGGEAAGAYASFIQAASTKDTAALRSLSLPERASDWDHFGVISSMQRTARQQPRVIAAAQRGDDMRLWVLSTLSDAALPADVEMKKLDGTWRFVRMVF